MTDPVTAEHLFGGCPECGGMDAMLNVGKSHWFVCDTHKTMWSPGNNLLSSWREETEEEQRRRWLERGMDNYREVLPVLPEDAIDPRWARVRKDLEDRRAKLDSERPTKCPF